MINDMIELASDLQKELLETIARQRPEDLEYAEDLNIVYEELEERESEAALRRRTSAEKRVRKVVLEMGERVTHGDLLTFQKFNQARALRSNSFRAVDRSAILSLLHYLKHKLCTAVLLFILIFSDVS